MKITIFTTTWGQLLPIFGEKFFIVCVYKYISTDTFIYVSVFLEFVSEILFNSSLICHIHTNPMVNREKFRNQS